LKNAADAAVVAPEVVAETSALLERLARAVQTRSALKRRKITEEARSLCHHALDAVAEAQGLAAPHELDALKRLVVGSETLSASLIRARMISEEK
jgi:predicted nucleic acid-binding protein